MDAGVQSVIIAYDGSGASRQAVAEAAKLLGPCRLVVVSVWEAGLAYMTATAPVDGMLLNPRVDPEFARNVDTTLHERAEQVANEGAELARSLGLEAEPLAVSDEGDVAHTVINLARERSAAAIVVGSRGLSGLRARLEGSTSKGLLAHAPCPVLVVHEPE
jgi:nucleotide-binding universal stress UspA family protein